MKVKLTDTCLYEGVGEGGRYGVLRELPNERKKRNGMLQMADLMGSYRKERSQ